MNAIIKEISLNYSEIIECLHKNKRLWYNYQKSVNTVLTVLITNKIHPVNGRLNKKERWNFPELKKEAMEQFKYWEPEMVIIEAKAS